DPAISHPIGTGQRRATKRIDSAASATVRRSRGSDCGSTARMIPAAAKPTESTRRGPSANAVDQRQHVRDRLEPPGADIGVVDAHAELLLDEAREEYETHGVDDSLAHQRRPVVEGTHRPTEQVRADVPLDHRGAWVAHGLRAIAAARPRVQ